MAITTPVIPTVLEGIKQDSALYNTHVYNNPVVGGFRNLCFEGQTANTSGSNAADQGIGTFSVPSGTTTGTKITVNNKLIGALSMVWLQATDDGGTITGLFCSPADFVAGTSFKVKVNTSGATTGAVDVWYLILN